MSKNFILAIFFLWSASAVAQANLSPSLGIEVDIVYLASDYLGGRLTGTEGELKSAKYIAARFEQAGLKPKGDEGSWYQVFPFKQLNNPHSVNTKPELKGEGRNVIGYLDNGASTTVIIGAHYDHLGMGQVGSRYTGEADIHNGADDNASGVAAMLYLAQHLSQAKNVSNNNYLFIAFSGEELGLFGSKYYADNPTIDLSTANYMLNLDMVGKLNKEKVLAINGSGTSPTWNELLTNMQVGGIQTKLSASGIGASDHTSFYLKNIPSLHFFTGAHKYYHTPSDDVEIINFKGILQVSTFIISLIEKVNDKGKLAFSKTVEKEERQAARFKVTLGVMPDYVYQGEGMRIDGIIPGRPAEKAGLKDGDIIIELGGMKISDIYKYMEALGKHEQGQQAEVKVKRGDEVMTAKVTF